SRGRGNRRQLRFEPSFLAGLRSRGSDPFPRKAESGFSRAHEGYGSVSRQCEKVRRTELRLRGRRLTASFGNFSCRRLWARREFVEVRSEGLYGHRLRRNFEY